MTSSFGSKLIGVLKNNIEQLKSIWQKDNLFEGQTLDTEISLTHGAGTQKPTGTKREEKN
jgi:hypothetical protein